MDPKQQRGYLNNNPGNMDRSEPRWDGELRDVNDPRVTPFQVHELQYGRFCVFVDAQHGIRALAKNILAYYNQLQLNSVNGIIDKWAPPNENNTTAYINRVCLSLGVTPNSVIDPRQRKTMRELVTAIINVECGGNPYTTEIDEGLTMAGIAA